MAAKTALITGATGLLGRAVAKSFEDAGWVVTGTGFSRASPPKIQKIDIQEMAQVDDLFDEVQPQVVVHCAADRQPDSCTRNPAGAHALNVNATTYIAQACSQHNSFLIYISTDYVFPGVAGEAPYTTLSHPKPTNVYGQTKLDGERAVIMNCTTTGLRAVVLRVPVLYGETEPRENNKESAVNVLMDSLYKSQNNKKDGQAEGDKVVMDDYAIRYPTNTADVGRVCVDIADLYTHETNISRTTSADKKKAPPLLPWSRGDRVEGREQEAEDAEKKEEKEEEEIKDEDLPQILHFSSEDRMTKYEICEKFGEIMGLDVGGLVRDRDSGKKPGPDGTLRPYDCHLDTSELKRLGIDVSTVDFVAWWRRWVGAFRH